LGPWLHRVAVRVALRARASAARRRAFETLSLEPAEEPDRGVIWQDDRRVLREELDRLPERYRLPLLLCYFEGKTNEQAAWQLRWPIGTIRGRLWRAREMLRARLSRRGLAPADGPRYSPVPRGSPNVATIPVARAVSGTSFARRSVASP